MPQSYEIDVERGLLRVRIEGNPSYPEMLDGFAAYSQDPDFRPGMAILVDDRGRTESPTSEEIRRLAQDTKVKGAEALKGSRCAILVGNETQFGMSRMYELTGAGGPIEVRVFMEEAAALDWLLAGAGGSST